MAEEAKDAGVPYTGPPVGSSGPYTGLGAAAAAADADGEGSDMDRDDRDTLEMTPFQKITKALNVAYSTNYVTAPPENPDDELYTAALKEIKELQSAEKARAAQFLKKFKESTPSNMGKYVASLPAAKAVSDAHVKAHLSGSRS